MSARKVWCYRQCVDNRINPEGLHLCYKLDTEMETVIESKTYGNLHIWYVEDTETKYWDGNGKRIRVWTITDPYSGLRICSVKATSVREMLHKFETETAAKYLEMIKHPTELYARANVKMCEIATYLEQFESPNKGSDRTPDMYINFDVPMETITAHVHNN